MWNFVDTFTNIQTSSLFYTLFPIADAIVKNKITSPLTGLTINSIKFTGRDNMFIPYTREIIVDWLIYMVDIIIALANYNVQSNTAIIWYLGNFFPRTWITCNRTCHQFGTTPRTFIMQQNFGTLSRLCEFTYNIKKWSVHANTRLQLIWSMLVIHIISNRNLINILTHVPYPSHLSHYQRI